ncbi:hypothetical protein PFZ49_05650 [Microbacterium lacticum]|uniref:hypothetical protein n=1 Tax=Microbacterium lacticum TaxID=33885 RepID=UPI003A86C325
MSIPAVAAQRHAVVFDCNVYLDVAEVLGEPYSLQAFNKRAAQVGRDPLPHNDSKIDSLRALAVCTSGRFAGAETLEVWTSDHIDRMVRNKAMHPTTEDAVTGFRGLGWSQASAEALVDDLVYGVIDASGGGTIGQAFPDGEPPLDHEDGLVYGACREVMRADALCRTYCVTNDRGFLSDAREGRLPDHTIVLAPARFVALVRSARAATGMQNVVRGSGGTS